MKILMLVPFLPNTSTSGGQTRWYNIIKYMSKTHRITLFSLIKDDSEKKFIPELEKYCERVMVFKRPKSPWTIRNLLLTVFSWYPLLVIRNFSFEERMAIKEILEKEKFDLIHAETFYVMPHIPKTDMPSILVEQTIEFQVYKHYVDNEVKWFFRPLFMIDVLKLRFWETFFWKKTNRLVAVSEDDKAKMRQLIPGIKVDIIPNGVDFNYFNSKKVKKLKPARILYGVTNFEWLQNREAVEILVTKVWPKVIKVTRNIKLWIVGRKIPKEIVNLSKSREDIEITESIKDARDAYLASSLMVTPIMGSGGTRLKILEAMAAGLPVISTSTGVAGLGLSDGNEAVIRDNVDDLALETIRLLKNSKVADRIGSIGQRFVKLHYDWKVIVGLHEPIYKEVVYAKKS